MTIRFRFRGAFNGLGGRGTSWASVDSIFLVGVNCSQNKVRWGVRGLNLEVGIYDAKAPEFLSPVVNETQNDIRFSVRDRLRLSEALQELKISGGITNTKKTTLFEESACISVFIYSVNSEKLR